MDTNQNFDSLDLQQIFENLPDDKKVEFLKDLQEIIQLGDDQLSDLERIITETIQEFDAEREQGKDDTKGRSLFSKLFGKRK